MTIDCSTTSYKKTFVQFQQDQNYDWSITIGIGFCPPDDEVIKRLTIIDAILSKKYLVGRYHKLPSEARFLIEVAFEGERSCGSRHAHVLVRIPTPLKNCSRPTLLSRVPSEFQTLWHKLNTPSDPTPSQWSPSWPKAKGKTQPLEFCKADVARTIYTVKRVQSVEEAWSRFEIVRPSQGTKFCNKNLSVVQNRDRQKRAALGLE
jgi:hypothetical protein